MIKPSQVWRSAALVAPAVLVIAAGSGRAVAAEAVSNDELLAEIRALRAQVQGLQARVDAQEKATASPPPAVVTAAVSTPTRPVMALAAAPAGPAAISAVEWRASPEFSGPNGYKFRVRGRFQYDAGLVENPDHRIPVDTLGFNSRTRRMRLGVEGWLPGDFQYKLEADFANAAIGYGDVILYWQPKGKVYSFGVGNYDTFQNLEQPSSSRYISFLERAQMVEAFDQTRHVGAWMTLADPAGDWRFNLGAFNDRIRTDNTSGVAEGSYGNKDWLLAMRALYTPQFAGGRLHVGVNYTRRGFQPDSLNQTYQTRPFTATTDQRFVSTGAIAAHGDQIMGAEVAVIHGPVHLVAEAQRVTLDAVKPGEVLSGRQATTGRRYNGDPSFLGWYAEAGVFLTGESRGYKAGLWDRTRVKHPVGQGGIGAIQLNLRYDHLNLNDRVSGTGFAAPDYVSGGKESGVLVSLIWQPMDYVRFTTQYTHAWVVGGPRGALFDAAAPQAGKFSSNILLARAQFDF